jgi:hypothetical protein
VIEGSPRVSVASGRKKGFRSAGRVEAGSSVAEKAAPHADDARPSWDEVDRLLERLATTHGVFPTANAASNWISTYEPGRRLMVESGTQSSWVQIDHIRACWNTFEERGRICRTDVLEPGRRSAFMMALFEQLPGVRREKRDGRYLVFAPGEDAA